MINSASSFRLKNCDKDGSTHLEWAFLPRNVLVIEKKHDQFARNYLIKSINYLHSHDYNVFVQGYIKQELQQLYSFLVSFDGIEYPVNSGNSDEEEDKEKNTVNIDFVLVFGGDGTLLHVSSMFPRTCPPIVPFAMGSLGFLTPFMAQDFENVIEEMIRGGFYVIPRTRIACTIVKNSGQKIELQAMNEVVLRTSNNKGISAIRCYIDDEKFTDVHGDGLIVATSTGSTAYNLSAGGAMVHPSVSALLWTPICPHSLNSHPLVLPDSTILSFKIVARNECQYTITYDAQSEQVERNDLIVVKVSPYMAPTVCIHKPLDDWFRSISNVLKWNEPIRALNE